MTREEYIDFANALKNNYTIDFDKLPEFCDMAISALKESRPKGEWLETFYDYECSNCRIIRAKGRTGIYNFCPNCGADMRGE